MRTFKRILAIVIVVALAAYVVASMTILNKPDENAVCNSIEISVLDSAQTGFITNKEIKKVLRDCHLYPVGKKMVYIDDCRIEEMLKNTPFINTAECYKSATGKICIEVTQRLPVLRIISSKGESYYLDEQGKIMPSSRYCANVVVATGEINRKYARKNLTQIGNFFAKDEFWNKQIEQINVTNHHEIEMIPRVGEHVIFLGKANDIEKKLAKLKIFYTHVLNKVGWNKYSKISLEFSNQIICTKK